MANYQIWVMNKFNRSDFLELSFGGYKEIFGNIDLHRKSNGYERESGFTLLETMIKHMAGKKDKLIRIGGIKKEILSAAVACFYIMGKAVEFETNFEYKGIKYEYLGRV